MHVWLHAIDSAAEAGCVQVFGEGVGGERQGELGRLLLYPLPRCRRRGCHFRFRRLHSKRD
jgi:hypothetical protein